MKPARLLGHSTHPPTTHVPLGLGLIVPVWDALALWSGQPRWWALAFWTAVAALIGAAPALTTGLLEFASLPQDGPEERLAYWHMGAMAAAEACLASSAIVRAGGAPLSGMRLVAAVACGCAAALVLGVGGWLGGELVYRYGVGTDLRLPQKVE